MKDRSQPAKEHLPSHKGEDIFQLPSRSEVYRERKKRSIQRFSLLWFRFLLVLLFMIILIVISQPYWIGWMDKQREQIEKPSPYHEEITIK
ncbi:hypothetical protein [Halobacillus sp. Marseille-Q1614]|uniref:hypothetical protein n=1 Tax=Halobacillus sp. Marseille-Q1614 TaxID=2709134 RepID=UPI001570E6AC|nr:hypothetical protein [Halobacillus sp. Marseille-Q1614]